jgi:hypothetical protein
MPRKAENSATLHSGPITLVRFRLGDREMIARGRDAWALAELVKAGADGLTPISRPAPRWSHYTWKLRRQGVDIETVTEAHGGAYSGHHARYVLRSPVEIIETQEAA